MSDESLSHVQSPKSFLQRFTKLFVSLKKIFKSKPYKSDEFSDYSAENLEIDKAFDNVKVASTLCENAVAIAQKRISLVSDLQEISVQEQTLDKFSALSDEDVETLKKLVSQYEKVDKEKATLKLQLGGVDRSLDFMTRYEDEMPSVINDVKEADDKRRLIKQDISYLEGEKVSLEYDKSTLESGLDFIYKFSVFLICLFSAVAVFFVFIHIIFSVEIFIFVSIEVFLAIFFGTSIYILKRKMKFELKKNVLFQIRVVELLNKRKLHYVHHTRYLDYVFKKYHAKSAEMLQNNWDEYCYYKHLSGRFKAVNNIIYDVADDINRFLEKRNMADTKFTIDVIAKSLNKSNSKRLKKEFDIEKKRIEAKLKDLDTEQEVIWKLLEDLQENDSTQEHIISNMIQNYLDEMIVLIK